MYKLRWKNCILALALFISGCIGKSSIKSLPSDNNESPISAIETTVPLITPSLQIDSSNGSLDSGCVKPFDEFAYTFWDLESEIGNVQVILPTYPWQVDDVVPSQQVEGYYPPFFSEVAAARSRTGFEEIWIEQNMLPFSGSAVKKIFVVYQPDLRSWRSISGNIKDTEFYVKSLFVTSDGSIWGSAAGEYYKESVVPNNKVPVLAKYNDNTHQFEFATGVLEIDLAEPDDPKAVWSPYFDGIEIVLDKRQNVFWIFVEKDGIYRYDPDVHETQKWLEADLRVFFEPVISPDGSIFVDDFRIERNIEPYFHLYQGALLQFYPSTKEVVPLEMPDEPWPWFSGWLISSDMKLWLGSVGYRTEDNSWHLLHPNTEEYFNNIGNPVFAMPRLMLESSNGLLWYQKYLDMGINHEGTAWYNPKTREGCMYTNLAVNIIEDSQQQLWLVADGKLYKNSLNP